MSSIKKFGPALKHSAKGIAQSVKRRNVVRAILSKLETKKR
jgi:hypothetical protein